MHHRYKTKHHVHLGDQLSKTVEVFNSKNFVTQTSQLYGDSNVPLSNFICAVTTTVSRCFPLVTIIFNLHNSKLIFPSNPSPTIMVNLRLSAKVSEA